MTKLQNRPQREQLPCFKAGISVVKKIKLTVVTRAGERFVPRAEILVLLEVRDAEGKSDQADGRDKHR